MARVLRCAPALVDAALKILLWASVALGAGGLLLLWRTGKLQELGRITVEFGRARMRMDFQGGDSGSRKATTRSTLAAPALELPPDEMSVLMQELPAVLARESESSATLGNAAPDDAMQFAHAESLLRHDPKAAKRIYEVIQQRSPSSAEALFGIARVYRRLDDAQHAIRVFKEVIRSDSAHEYGARVRAELVGMRSEIRNGRRLKQILAGLREKRPMRSVFCFERLPEPQCLAQHLTALANRRGGTILIGISRTGDVTAAVDLHFPAVLEAAWLQYSEPPPFFDSCVCEYPPAILIDVDEGVAKPYSAATDEGFGVFVPDRAGSIRPATAVEINRLKGLHG